MTGEEFLLSAKRLLQAQDYALIEKLLQDHGGDLATDNAAARAWIRFDRNFRNEIAALRAQRLQKDPQKSIRGEKESEPALREIAQQALKIPDLLEAQKLVDKTYWQFLDELAAGHYFDLEFLICYGLKLKILTRHQEYDSPKGEEVFKNIQTVELPIHWAVPGI